MVLKFITSNIFLFYKYRGDLMIIDAHVHIGSDVDGASQSIKKLKSNMARYGIDKSII